jgi:hypothetical protein
VSARTGIRSANTMVKISNSWQQSLFPMSPRALRWPAVDRGKWKVKAHSKADFTLNKGDFNTENIEFRYIGIRKVSETSQPYGIEESFGGWSEFFEKHNLKVEFVEDERIYNANNIEIYSLAGLIQEIIHEVEGISFRNNAFFLICLEFFITAWDQRATHEQTFASIEGLVSDVHETWGVDLIGELESFANYVYSELEINCGIALSELFRIVGVPLEFE